MNSTVQHHLMLKILIGSAWVDGVLESHELDYLHTLLDRYGEEHNAELRKLLAKPTPIQQTEQWMAEYLYNATGTERQQLLGAMGNLLYSDRDVTASEHVLIDDFYTMTARIPAHAEPPEVVQEAVHSVGQLVKNVVRKVAARIKEGRSQKR
jgi:hypothetical protein